MQNSAAAELSRSRRPPPATAETKDTDAPMARWWRGEITVVQLFVALMLGAVWISLVRTDILPNDFWWHLRTGGIIMDTGAIPTTDLFTYTRAGEPWINQAWLMQVLFYLLYRAGGPEAVVFGHMVIVTAGFGFLLAACRRQTPSLVSAVGGVAAAVILSRFAWTVRPQAISILLFAITVWILEEERHGNRRPLWALPPLFALWANAHGGFLFGGGLVALYAGSRVLADAAATRRPWPRPQNRPLLLAAALAAGALALNPQGIMGLVDYVLGFGRSQTTMENNIEFYPLHLRAGLGKLFFGINLLFAAVAYARRIRLPLDRLLVLLCFAAACLYSQRILLFYGLAAAPIFTLIVAREKNIQNRPLPPRLRGAALIVLLLLFTLPLPWLRPLVSDAEGVVNAAETPVAATRSVCELSRSQEVRVFSDIAYGVFQSWACPSLPVFMDTRFELYPTEMWDEYLRLVVAQHGWQENLSDLGINTLVLNRERQKELVRAAAEVDAWTLLYEDDYTVVYHRETP